IITTEKIMNQTKKFAIQTLYPEGKQFFTTLFFFNNQNDVFLRRPLCRDIKNAENDKNYTCIGEENYMSLDISIKLAQDIINKIKEIIHQDINYINTEGIITASTVQNRIGSFHGGGKRVINTKNNLVINYDGEYKGILKG